MAMPDPSSTKRVPDPRTGRVLVFDSGMGGLTIVEALRRSAPRLTVDYAADSGFFPYGDKSDAALRARLPAVARALYETARPDVFVIACNTASTLALEEVRTVLPVAVVGTVPAIKPAAAMSRTGTIGLLATPGTLARSYTADLIRSHAAGTTVIRHGSIDLVQLAEAHAAGEDLPLEAFNRVQAALFDQPGGEAIDVVVLACTHFPLVREQLIASAPRLLDYIDSGAAIARQTLRMLPDRLPARERLPSAWLTSHLAGQERLVKVFETYGFETVRSPIVPATAGSMPAP